MSLRDLIDTGRPLVGGLCSLPGWYAVQTLAGAGFDWLFIDTEHAPIDASTLAVMLQAAELFHTPTIVRVAWNRPELIGWTLDMGAAGVMVPMINTAAQARDAVSAARYPPLGHRSWGPTRCRRADKDYSVSSGNKLAICAVLIETAEAVANLDAILDVEGIDIVAIGQSDLAISHGIEPSAARSGAEHMALIRGILDKCKARGITSWINCTDHATAEHWVAEGFGMISLDNDVAYLAKGAAAACADLRQFVSNISGKPEI